MVTPAGNIVERVYLYFEPRIVRGIPIEDVCSLLGNLNAQELHTGLDFFLWRRNIKFAKTIYFKCYTFEAEDYGKIGKTISAHVLFRCRLIRRANLGIAIRKYQ